MSGASDALPSRRAALHERNADLRATWTARWSIGAQVPVLVRAAAITNSAAKQQNLMPVLQKLHLQTDLVEEVPDGTVRVLFTVPARAWTLDDLNRWTDEILDAVDGNGFGRFAGITGWKPMERTDQVLQHLMQHQRAGNVEVWKLLRAQGVTDQTVLALDGQFICKSKASATAIAAWLREDLQHEVTVQPPRRPWLPFRRYWDITATRTPRPASTEETDAWTDALVTAAYDHGVEFDGWGTLVPE